MIVKKMPILQGFPDLETVIFLSKSVCEFSDNNCYFYDIETTGLSKSTSYVYLIGAIACKSNQWILYQWFAESAHEEIAILQEFSSFAAKYHYAFQYNGDRFDQPFLEARYEMYHLPSPFSAITSIDLYKHLKICQKLWKLERMKQPDLEAFLGIDARCNCDGGQCIKLYKKYQKMEDSKLLEVVLGHNEEDLLGLGKICLLFSCLALFQGNLGVTKAEVDSEHVIFTLSLPLPVPVEFSNGNEFFYLSVCRNTARLMIPLKGGKIRQFYENPKQYVYLPGEDSVIPKSLSAYMDKSLYVPASKEDCYTWVVCDEMFLSDSEKMLQYLRRTLPVLLKMLK